MESKKNEANKATVAAPTNVKPKSALELLEEDDEFEEFEGANLQNQTDAEDKQLWQDDWEDDNVNDDFTAQLREQIQSRIPPAAATSAATAK